MKTLRLSLLLLTLQVVLFGSANTVTLSGPVSSSQLNALSKVHPEMTALDLSNAVIEDNIIPPGAFAGTKLQAVTFPASGNIVIGDGAFMGTPIASLTLPISVKSIGAGAFAACPNLSGVTLYGAEIGDYAFHLCAALQWVEFGLTSKIGDHAFDGCTALRKFTSEGAITQIGDFAFANTGLVVVDLSNCANLTQVGAWAFANDSDLTGISFPHNAVLGDGVLFNCPALRDLNLPENLPAVPDFAFTGSTGSTGYYTVPDGVETIGAFAYKDTDLGHIVLPSALNSIGTGAMENTPRLSIIDAGNLPAVPELGEDVWKGVDKNAVQLLVPQDMTADYKAALQWQDFKLDVSGIDNPEVAEVAVRAAFDGDNLILEAVGSEIVRVEIFNEAGATFVDQHTNSSLLAIPAGSLAIRLFLVRCTLADGSVATLKLTR